MTPNLRPGGAGPALRSATGRPPPRARSSLPSPPVKRPPALPGGAGAAWSRAGRARRAERRAFQRQVSAALAAGRRRFLANRPRAARPAYPSVGHDDRIFAAALGGNIRRLLAQKS